MGDNASAASAKPAGRGISQVSGETRHTERLYLPWWCWPLPLLAAALLAAEIHMGYPGLRAWLPYVITLPVAVALLIILGRVQVRVIRASGASDSELWVGEAHLPLRFIGDVEVIERQNKRKALGPELDPSAFVVHRGWIGTALRVWLTDPDDPTPYWLFSTRHPAQLADVLRARSHAAGNTDANDGAAQRE